MVVGTIVVSQYVGLSTLIPVGVGLVGVLLSRAPARRPMSWAVGALAGHLAWSVVGLFHNPQSLLTVGADVVFTAGAVLWLLLKPSRGALLLIGLLEVAVLTVNSADILTLAWGSVEHRSLSLHILLRLVFLGGAVSAWPQLPRRTRTVATQPS